MTALLILLFSFSTIAAAQAVDPEELASMVEIRRTDYGVPHIVGEDLRSAAFGLGYVQAEDYGEDVVRQLLTARGEMARAFGREHVDRDVLNRQRHAWAVETFHLLDPDVRAMLEGFAEGVNHYIRVYRDELPDWVRSDFVGHDVAAKDIGWADPSSVRRFVRRLEEDEDDRVAPDDYATIAPWRSEPIEDTVDVVGPDPGSNTWALAPSRTASGNAILMRNPHLSWDAGYYEAHLRVPGIINFYGDFRIGGPFTTVGGFSDHVGFSTTNNYLPLREIYALEVDTDRADHYLFDGSSVPIRRELVSVESKNGESIASESREALHTPLGPVIYRGNGWIYVLRVGNHRQFRVGEQFLGMMRARSYEEWEEAMRIRAHPYSNFTYADRHGNIAYISSGSTPTLPHPSGGDTLAIPARTSADVWASLVPFDSLPSLKNPQGGYLRNENDPFHLTNLYEPMLEDDFPESFPEPHLRLRSIHSLELLHNDRTFTLEDVVEAKHSMRMLLADRVKDDLLTAIRASDPSPRITAAADIIERWDNTVSADAVGAVLFREWWAIYQEAVETDVYPMEQDPALFRVPWTLDDPLATPRGLADLDAAADAFEQAGDTTEAKWGDISVAWGEVHRARLGDVDEPVGGCHGALGCFRTLWFREDEDGLRRIRGGDGWVLAVEFADPPRAYSVLAYGQSNRPESPHHTDQVELFARNAMKPVHFTEESIRQATTRSYHPGEERARRE